MLIFFFFFSSRRRHTRWNCDWSSDVCSSDLFREQVLARRTAAIRGLLARGIDRGELRPDLDLEIGVDLLLGPIYYRLLMSGEPLTSGFIDRLVRAVMAYGQGN